MRRSATVLAIAGIATLGALAAWPVLRISSALREGERAARASYGDLRREALNRLGQPADAGDRSWMDAAREAWNRDGRLLAVVVSHPAEGVLFALPSSSHYYVEPSSPNASPSYDIPARAVAKYSGALSSGMVIDALYATVRQRDIFLPLRDAGLAALVLALGCAAWLIASAGTRERGPERAAAGYEPGAGRVPARRRTAPAAYPAPPEPSVDDTPPDEPRHGEPSTWDASPAGSPDPFDLPGLDGIPDLPPPDPEPRHASASMSDKDLGEGGLGGPKGLYDPATGLGWESYLRERLSAELKRSASFEQDLCLLLASLDDAERGSEAYVTFARTAQEFFSFKDLSFVFGERGVAIILPNMDVDHAIRMSEELLKKLTFLIKGPAGTMSYLELFMGLSSRSGRLVDAERLIGESVAALRKAREERDTHIMAFRPDPEKFRAFLASQ